MFWKLLERQESQGKNAIGMAWVIGGPKAWGTVGEVGGGFRKPWVQALQEGMRSSGCLAERRQSHWSDVRRWPEGFERIACPTVACAAPRGFPAPTTPLSCGQ
jgi:hypothetical protein